MEAEMKGLWEAFRNVFFDDREKKQNTLINMLACGSDFMDTWCMELQQTSCDNEGNAMRMEERKDGKHMRQGWSHFAADLTNIKNTDIQNSCQFKQVGLKVWSLEQPCQLYQEIW